MIKIIMLIVLSIIFTHTNTNKSESSSVIDVGEDYPTITSVGHTITYAKTKQFVYMDWTVSINGGNSTRRMILEIVLYDKDKRMITKFSEIVDIKANEVQVFTGKKMFESGVVYRLNNVGAKLALLTKKY